MLADKKQIADKDVIRISDIEFSELPLTGSGRNIWEENFMNIYETLMYGVMIIFALASNVSTGITSACIVISAIIMMIQYIKTKKLPLQINAFWGVLLLYGGL